MVKSDDFEFLLPDLFSVGGETALPGSVGVTTRVVPGVKNCINAAKMVCESGACFADDVPEVPSPAVPALAGCVGGAISGAIEIMRCSRGESR